MFYISIDHTFLIIFLFSFIQIHLQINIDTHVSFLSICYFSNKLVFFILLYKLYDFNLFWYRYDLPNLSFLFLFFFTSIAIDDFFTRVSSYFILDLFVYIIKCICFMVWHSLTYLSIFFLAYSTADGFQTRYFILNPLII